MQKKTEKNECKNLNIGQIRVKSCKRAQCEENRRSIQDFGRNHKKSSIQERVEKNHERNINAEKTREKSAKKAQYRKKQDKII